MFPISIILIFYIHIKYYAAYFKGIQASPPSPKKKAKDTYNVTPKSRPGFTERVRLVSLSEPSIQIGISDSKRKCRRVERYRSPGGWAILRKYDFDVGYDDGEEQAPEMHHCENTAGR